MGNNLTNPPWIELLPIAAVLLAAFIPLLFGYVRSYIKKVWELETFLLHFRDLRRQVEKQVEELKEYAQLVHNEPDKSHTLTVKPIIEYDWASQIEWQVIFEASRIVLRDPLNTTGYIQSLRRVVIGTFAANKKLQESHADYHVKVNRYQEIFQEGAKNIMSIVRHHSQLPIVRTGILREVRAIVDRTPSPETGLVERYNNWIVPLEEFRSANRTDQLVVDLLSPINLCNEGYINIRNIANEYSSMYKDIAEYLDKAGKSIEECLRRFGETKYRIGPIKSLYIKLASWGRIGTWKRDIIEDSPTIDPQKTSGGRTTSQAANPE